MEPVDAVLGAELASATSNTTALDRAIGELRDGERTWAHTPLAIRRDLLCELVDAAWREADSWVQTAARIKGLDPASPLVGEEWLSGPYALLSSASALAETMGALASGHDPLAGYTIGGAPGERTTIEVLPHGIYDRLLLTGYRASVWMRPGVSAEQARATAGLAQRAPKYTRGVALVLGAGNITSIAPLDVLYQLYAENRVVMLKLNPVLDRLRPVLDRIFAPLIRRDLVRIVTGGAAEGTYLAEHPAIAAVHMTGSAATHDTIVFGPGADGAARKAASEPRLDKPITSELGGVSPVIVVPGRWSDSDLRFQAEHVATMKLHNAGHNCIAAQILLLPAAWPQKQRFLELLDDAIANAPARPTWYDGATARAEDAARRPAAKRYGHRVLVGGIDIDNHTDASLRDEWFAPVLGIAELPGDDPASFIRAAVDAANERLHGTLGANVITHPRSIRALGPHLRRRHRRTELRHGRRQRLDRPRLPDTARDLGRVPRTPAHRHPKRTRRRPQRPPAQDTERTVLRGPFRPRPKPPWFVTNRTAAVTGTTPHRIRRPAQWAALSGIFASALRG